MASHKAMDLGSGGASYGGGAIRIVVSTLFANDELFSNGNSSSSGGSVYVTANNMAGSGTFSANGGNLYAVVILKVREVEGELRLLQYFII